MSTTITRIEVRETFIVTLTGTVTEQVIVITKVVR